MTTRARHGHRVRHARAYPGHPLLFLQMPQTWMAGTSPAMTAELAAHPSYPHHPQPQRYALAVMRMRDGDRERVGGVGGFRLGLGQQDFQHHQDLILVGMSGADHGFLHLVRGIFRHRYPEHRRRQHRNAARLAKLQRGDTVLVDEGLFDRGFCGAKIAEHGGEALMNSQQAARQRQAFRRFHRAATDEYQPVAVDLDHPPAGTAQARIDAKNADRMANRLMGHGTVITPERGGRNLKQTVIPRESGTALSRHCERSEAIQSAKEQDWIAS